MGSKICQSNQPTTNQVGEGLAVRKLLRNAAKPMALGWASLAAAEGPPLRVWSPGFSRSSEGLPSAALAKEGALAVWEPLPLRFSGLTGFRARHRFQRRSGQSGSRKINAVVIPTSGNQPISSKIIKWFVA